MIKIACDKRTTNSCDKIISWNDYTKEKLIENLRRCDWTCFEMYNIEQKLNMLRSNLQTAVMPLLKRVTIKTESKPKKWFDDELASVKHHKLIAYSE